MGTERQEWQANWTLGVKDAPEVLPEAAKKPKGILLKQLPDGMMDLKADGLINGEVLSFADLWYKKTTTYAKEVMI